MGKWTGAAAGLVLGIVIAAVLLAPLYTVVHIVENTPETTIAIAGESFLDEELTLDTEGAMYVSDFAFVNKIRQELERKEQKGIEETIEHARKNREEHMAGQARNRELRIKYAERRDKMQSRKKKKK